MSKKQQGSKRSLQRLEAERTEASATQGTDPEVLSMAGRLNEPQKKVLSRMFNLQPIRGSQFMSVTALWRRGLVDAAYDGKLTDFGRRVAEYLETPPTETPDTGGTDGE